jgi:hypothetical protein
MLRNLKVLTNNAKKRSCISGKPSMNFNSYRRLKHGAKKTDHKYIHLKTPNQVKEE